MSYQHSSLADGRWANMTLSEQMANIGSEISRALTWQKKGKETYCQKAVFRALELISLTINSVTIKSHLKELTRLREAINDYFFGNNEFVSSDVLWQKYFNHFNYAARKNVLIS
jgi:hypothetical protein